MRLRVPTVLLTGATLVAALTLPLSQLAAPLTDPTPRVLHADGSSAFDDPDGDMVPNCLELLGMTDPTKSDTDGDGIDDFEEILTFTSHDPQLKPKPVDHTMRVLVTSTPYPNGRSEIFVHLMLRFVNLGMDQVAFQDLFAHVEGVEVSLLDLLGYGEILVEQRERKRDGVSYLFSMRVSSEEDLQRILPCTICARAVLGGRLVTTGSLLVDSGSEVAAVMPFSESSMILQSVSSEVALQESSQQYNGGGRVCEMRLASIGTSKSGTVCEVESAICKRAAGLRCASTCPKKVGTTVVIPDGLGTITGQR